MFKLQIPYITSVKRFAVSIKNGYHSYFCYEEFDLNPTKKPCKDSSIDIMFDVKTLKGKKIQDAFLYSPTVEYKKQRMNRYKEYYLKNYYGD